VHGYPDNHRVWDRVAADLSRDFLVIRYDVRGAGRSGKPGRTREYRLALLAQDLRAVVDTLIPGRPFHLVAHDWGAIQSWESATAPELASRLRSYTAISWITLVTGYGNGWGAPRARAAPPSSCVSWAGPGTCCCFSCRCCRS
jgi:pimeloyl-ACP methyl ester carboxylesterase